MQSFAILHSFPRSSERRAAHGLREYLSSGPSFGRPRWDERSTFAPLSIRYFTVGTDARMRVSSVMVLPSSGTFKSQRTRTFLPLRSASARSPTDFLAISMSATRATLEDASLVGMAGAKPMAVWAQKASETVLYSMVAFEFR